MITRYHNYINEDLKIKDIDDKTLNTLENNFIDKLKEYKEYILSNIEVDPSTNKIKYKEFDKLNIDTIVRELSNEFSDDFIRDINAEAFIRKINQILILKKSNTKKKIRESFSEYNKTIKDRIEQLKSKTTDYEDIVIPEGEGSILPRKQYESEKYLIQVELLKLQKWAIDNNKKIAIVFEGRDAAGKGSTIKRFTEYLNPKGFKIVALGVPTPDESKNWLQRYEKYLPKAGEMIFFDRSWYNRAVIEPSLGYCTEDQYNDFMSKVNDWEEKQINNGLILIKLWFSITKDKQLKRFELRKKSPLKYWKFSPNDSKVLDKWDIIGKFKNQMFINTSTEKSPWVIINSNDKKIGRLNAMRYVLSIIEYNDKNEDVCEYYPEVVTILK